MPRSWARPRELLALQPTDNRPRTLNRVLRTALRDWRAPAPTGEDSWSLGTLCRRPLRSLPEMHLLTVAPTRSGKTTASCCRRCSSTVARPSCCSTRPMSCTPPRSAARSTDRCTSSRRSPLPTPSDASRRVDAAARLRGLGARAANGPLDLRRPTIGVGGLQRLRRRALLQPRRDRRRAAAAAAGRSARPAQHDRRPHLAARGSGGTRRAA
jgi:hypothetical protein